MRRFASVFVSKRESKAEPSPSSSTLRASQSAVSLLTGKKSLKRTNTLTVTPLNTTPPFSSFSNDSAPPTPALSAPSQSSASSTGSASLFLQTPEPEDGPVTARPKSWRFWSSRKSSIHKSSKRPAEQARDPPSVVSPPTRRLQPPQSDVAESDDESSESEEEEDESNSEHVPTARATQPPHSSAHPTKVLQVVTQNSLRHRRSAMPFLHISGVPLFPRSCNHSSQLTRPAKLEATMFKRRLLRRLQADDLSPAELASLQPLSMQPCPPLASPDCSDLIEPPPPKTSQVSHFSTGLHRWLLRPCFEDRFTIWLNDGGTITSSRVTASRSVAELEFSAAVNAMVDFNVETPIQPQYPIIAFDPPDSPTTPPSESNISPSSSSSSLSSLAPGRNSPYINTPSPLRNEHNPLEKVQILSADVADVPPAEPSPPIKRGVRFAEDDKEDVIPIGYTLRIKKQKEEKARFLREQQEERKLAEERARVEAERAKMEQERQQWERERQAWEAEKQAMEAERKKRMYAAEVTAARERRESQRQGHSAHASPTSSIRDKSDRRMSRPVYDAGRRLASEPAMTNPSLSPAHSPSNSSPSSSRPPSVHGAQLPPLPSPPHANSRSPSVYSSHSLSSIEGPRPAMNKKRHSIASSSVAPAYSMWSASNPSLTGLVPPIPALPAMPTYTMEMPLLPPTAPFMLYQYPRPKANGHSQSPSASSSSLSRRLPSNSSNPSLERVNVPSAGQSQRHQIDHHPAPSSSHSPQRLASPSQSPHRQHQRRSSGDGRRASLAPSAYDDRGRAPLPQSYTNSLPRSATAPVLPPLYPQSWNMPSFSPGGPQGSSNTSLRHRESKNLTLPRSHRQNTAS